MPRARTRQHPARILGWSAVGVIGALALAGTALMIGETISVAASVLTADVTAAHLAAASGDQHSLIAPMTMDSAVATVRHSVQQRLIPGAAVVIGNRDSVVDAAGIGRVGWRMSDAAVSVDSTVYDLASLTKAVATTSAVLLLAQDGKINLDDRVQKWVPEFDGVWKDRVTWRQLLTHTSGLPPAGRMTGKTPAQRLRSLLRTKLDVPPGTAVQYSDLSFIVLWTAAERVAHEPLSQFLDRRVWRPLGMTSTAFWPGSACEQCAPTLVLNSGQPYRGKPSDPTAHKLGIPTGNAGLFSTAHDLARFAEMIAGGGELHGVRVLREDLVDSLLQQAPHAGHRTLGWDAFCPAEHPTSQRPCAHPIAYGHTGWTGTSLWIDPARGLWVIILSNRSYNVKRPPSLDDLRRDVFLRAEASDTNGPVRPPGID